MLHIVHYQSSRAYDAEKAHRVSKFGAFPNCFVGVGVCKQTIKNMLFDSFSELSNQGCRKGLGGITICCIAQRLCWSGKMKQTVYNVVIVLSFRCFFCCFLSCLLHHSVAFVFLFILTKPSSNSSCKGSVIQILILQPTLNNLPITMISLSPVITYFVFGILHSKYSLLQQNPSCILSASHRP